MPRLLLLGGSLQQVPAIEQARQLSCETILCDYLPHNPGRLVADRFYCVSTTEREAVLQVARKEHIDGILAYASDPAAPTAAWVAEQLGLPGQPLQAVQILTEKDRFRAFLAAQGFAAPLARSYRQAGELLRDWHGLPRPLMLKPVDSSGSKGVSRISRPEEVGPAFSRALSFSRVGRVIGEAFVNNDGYQVAGDGFSVDGRLVFCCFGNDHFAAGPNLYVPVAASFPLNRPDSVHQAIHATLQRLFDLLGLKTGAYNFDVRLDRTGRVWLMEVGPRNGGNFIPQVIRHATGVDLIELSIRAALGLPLPDLEQRPVDGFWSYYAIHSSRAGRLERIEIDTRAARYIVAQHLAYLPGAQVPAFNGASGSIGILIMRFPSMTEMLRLMDHGESWIRVVVCPE